MQKETLQMPEKLDEKRLKAVFESAFLQKKLSEAKASYTKVSDQITNLVDKLVTN